MNTVTYCKFFAVVLLFLLCFNVSGQRATRQSAQDAFDKGDYAKAYSEYIDLLDVYSKDPVYKYYASVCLIRLGQNPEQAETLIREAIENNTAARAIPSDAMFYHARALQMNGNFSHATGLYQRFANQAGRRTAREYRVQDYINQCSKGEGAVAKTQPETITNSAAIPIFTAPPEIVAEKTAPPAEPLPEDFSDLLDKAIQFQFSADSARRVNVAENEKLAASYQNSADEMFAAAQALMNPKKEEPETPPEPIKTNETVAETNDNQPEIEDEIIVIPAATRDVYYYFKITDAPSAEAIPIDPEIPEGLNYRIQMGVFRNPVSPVFFKGITPVYGIRSANNPELKTYYAGMFRRVADARNALTEIKNRGFRDSFIVSFSGSQTVSANRAEALELEWGTKPFERVVDNKQVQIIADEPTAAADTLPPTLVFRVETMRVTRAATPAAVEAMRTLAGNRGLDIITTEDKKIAYVIGSFITYESAAEYADLLVRNGYRDTRVVAWLGNREMPLETAKQLFDSLR